jgi:hypothetical protein
VCPNTGHDGFSQAGSPTTPRRPPRPFPASQTLDALFEPREGGSTTNELDRLVRMLERERAGREREVRDLTSRLEAAERERDAALDRLRQLAEEK